MGAKRSVKFSITQKILVVHTYKLFHNIALKTIKDCHVAANPVCAPQVFVYPCSNRFYNRVPWNICASRHECAACFRCIF